MAFAQHQLRRPRLVSAPGPMTISVRLTFPQHQQAVRAIAWAPNASMVASGGNDDFAFVWNLDGTVLHTLAFHAPVRAIAWSPDGMQFATGVANTISFFDAHTAVLLSEQTGLHTAAVTSLGWTAVQSSAPLAISAGSDNIAIVWSGLSHQPQVIFQQHTTAIEALTVLADTVVTASQGGIARVWSALSGQELHGYYSDTQQAFRAVAFSSEGSLALGGDDGAVHLWGNGRTCTRQVQDIFGVHCLDEATRLQGHRDVVRAIAFSPDGTRLATGGDDKKLIIWSVPHKVPLLIQPQHDVLAALSWAPSGQYLAGAVGSHVNIWQFH
jgi:WD40 repeat protein